MSKDYEIEGFWQAFISTLPRSIPVPNHYRVWYFGNSEEMALELGMLVKEGVKTATCSLLWEHEFGGDPLPNIGEYSIITDWQGHPMCIIQTTDVSITPFDEVDENFAFEEGEGDRSLAYWRETHWRFFGRLCESMGSLASSFMPLVCERFHLVFS